MEKLKAQQIFDIIKSDDLVAFSCLEKFDYSLGRFPLLSVCYLYNSKKILKVFEDKLACIVGYSVLDEPLCLSNDFKKIAQKSLKLYLNGETVEPVQMLAILHKNQKVKRFLKKYVQSEKTLENLQFIYQNNHKQTLKISSGKPKFSLPKLSLYQKRFLRLFMTISACFVLAFSGVWLSIAVSVGDGSNLFPAKISTTSQLSNALKSNAKFILTNDIELPENMHQVATFNGVLDLNGHKMSVQGQTSQALFAILNGTIKNGTIEFADLELSTSSSQALVCQTNNGTLQNINLTTGQIALNQAKQTTEVNYFSLFAIKNCGVIDACDVNSNITTIGTGSGDGYTTCFVGENEGVIKNCVVSANSSVTATDIDTAGFVAVNNGEIMSSKNYAQISQHNTVTGWNPNVAGIACSNTKKIYDCYNFGNLSMSSADNTESNVGLTMYIGGICAQNVAEINHCLNNANLSATSIIHRVYCGGITAISNSVSQSDILNNSPILTNCGASGVVTIQTQNDTAFVFAGGISGYLYGKELSNCYSTMSFTQGNDTTKNMVGSILGMTYLNYNMVLIASISSNYYLVADNVLCSVGAFLTNNQIMVNAGNGVVEISACQTIQDLQSKDIFWTI